MTTKKRLTLIAALPLIIAVTLTVFAMFPAVLPPQPGVTKANYDRIEKGMREAEIKQIFGKDGMDVPVEMDVDVTGYVWVADDGSTAYIWFDKCSVTNKQWLDSNETILDKIHRWLHLR